MTSWSSAIFHLQSLLTLDCDTIHHETVTIRNFFCERYFNVSFHFSVLFGLLTGDV